MLLRKLRLQNFRQFKEIEVEFSPGLIAIVGANGSGKTTLLEAISWALYGEKRKNKDTLRHMWADGKDKVSVTLEFSLGARIFFIERTFDKAVLSELAPDGERILAAGLTSVSDEVVRLLHLTHKQFTNSFCAE